MSHICNKIHYKIKGCTETRKNMTLDAKKITWNGLGIALVCISTMAIQIPIPLGYCHLGNCMILLISFLFPWQTGLLAGGVGSALADLLTGFPQWILPTLIIKKYHGIKYFNYFKETWQTY